MKARELRQKYLEFFQSKGHQLFPSGSLVPYDVTGKLDESLLFNGAGMVQFKPFFRGLAQPPSKRLTNSQKCVRTGDIEEVGDLTHLTFFEMMGNFSFGDYFKEEAIAYSWEFMTSKDWLGLDPNRLSFTVFSEDDEAFECWSKHVSSVGIEPETRIFRLGEETNYWPAGAFSNGPPGPCGPNSEMFYWTPLVETPPSGAYTREDYLRDEKLGKWLEIWNDVFIQYEWQGELKNPDRPGEGYRKSAILPLPFQSVDTGMGLERTAAAIGGFKSVYDTDLFAPVIQKIETLSAHRVEYRKDPAKDRAVRIIADHIRTACFCIADGILPGNTGRGYVLRRLIRRAVLKGQRVLGFDKPFFKYVFDGVHESLGDHYSELGERRDVITETLDSEERLFRRTVNAGYSEFEDYLRTHQGLKVFPGEQAFYLYDTHGFPLEVTQELCEEAGISVDLDGYEAALKEAQERSRGSSGMDTVYGGHEESLVLVGSQNAQPSTVFLGYEVPIVDTELVQISPRFDENNHCTNHFQICLAATPFYAESGGQVGDTGTIQGPDFEFKVINTWRQMGQIWHDAELVVSPVSVVGMGPVEAEKLLAAGVFFKPVRAQVDLDRRRAIMRNHTATHLLHAALRQTLGKHVTQAGSLVGPDYLRFDFTHGKALTAEETSQIERLVNEHALQNDPVITYVDVPVEQAKAMGAMALFGEKYSDHVRVVQVGSMPPTEASWSRELCGGTHVRATGEIGLFKILHESSAASGVRRIEAVTGLGAYQWALQHESTLESAAELLKSNPADLIRAVEKAIENQKDLNRKIERLRTQTADSDSALVVSVGGIELAMQRLDDADLREATLTADRMADGKPNRVVLVAATHEGKVFFVSKVGKDALAKGASAGNLVRDLAKIAGGGGGGRPDFATAGGKDPSKLENAMNSADAIVAGMVGAN